MWHVKRPNESMTLAPQRGHFGRRAPAALSHVHTGSGTSSATAPPIDNYEHTYDVTALVDGHRDMRFAGYVCVTATSVEELEDAWATTIHDAGRARLRLRPLHGEHWPALGAVLPLGRFF